MRSKVLFAIVLFSMVATSCHYKEEYRNDECYKVYKVKSVTTIERTIKPEVEFDPSFDFLSREYYSGLDSTLAIKGWFHKRGLHIKMRYNHWSLIDWRIKKIDVVTLEDFDKDHPAGSSLNDVVLACFYYKENYIEIPLDKIEEYGGIMLVDYYPGNEPPYDTTYDNSINEGIYIEVKEDENGLRKPLRSGEVIIEDYFGNKFSGVIPGSF